MEIVVLVVAIIAAIILIKPVMKAAEMIDRESTKGERKYLARHYRAGKTYVRRPSKSRQGRAEQITKLETIKLKFVNEKEKYEAEAKGEGLFKPRRSRKAVVECQEAIKRLNDDIILLQNWDEAPPPPENRESVFRDDDYETGSVDQQPEFEERHYERNGSNSKIMIPCPSCGQPLRVPINQGKIRIKCPACKHSWCP